MLKMLRIFHKCIHISRNASFHPCIQMTNGYVQTVCSYISKLRFVDCISCIFARLLKYFKTSTVEYWILDIGYWILDIGYWILNIEYWILDIEYWILNIEYWLLNIEYWSSALGNLGLLRAGGTCWGILGEPPRAVNIHSPLRHWVRTLLGQA